MKINQQALLADHTGTDVGDWAPIGQEWEHKKLWMMGKVTIQGTKVKVDVKSTDPDTPEPIDGYEGDLNEPYLKKFVE